MFSLTSLTHPPQNYFSISPEGPRKRRNGQDNPQVQGSLLILCKRTVTATAHPGRNQHRPWGLPPAHALAPVWHFTAAGCRTRDVGYIFPVVLSFQTSWFKGPLGTCAFSRSVSPLSLTASFNLYPSWFAKHDQPTRQPELCSKCGVTSTEWKAPSSSGYSLKEGSMLKLGFTPDSKELLLPPTDTIRVNTAYQGGSTMSLLSFIPFDSSWDVLSKTQSKSDQDLDHRGFRPCITGSILDLWLYEHYLVTSLALRST